MSHIERAIELTGGLSALAEKVGARSPQVVSNWRLRDRVPVKMAIAIERATAGAVTCEELRPDVDWSVLRGSAREAA